MYYAKGIGELIKSSQLSLEFFEQLDEFQLYFIEMCFKKDLEENMGMITQVEEYNYQLFQDYKAKLFYDKHGIFEDWYKKSA